MFFSQCLTMTRRYLDFNVLTKPLKSVEVWFSKSNNKLLKDWNELKQPEDAIGYHRKKYQKKVFEKRKAMQQAINIY